MIGSSQFTDNGDKLFTDHSFHNNLISGCGVPGLRRLVVSQMLIDLIEAQFPGTLQPRDDGYDWTTSDGTVVRLSARVEVCD